MHVHQGEPEPVSRPLSSTSTAPTTAHYGGFTLKGDGTEQVANGINLTWTTAASRSTSANTLENINIRNLNFVTGLSLAGVGARQLDGTVLDDIMVSGGQAAGAWTTSGNWQYGIVYGNGSLGKHLRPGRPRRRRRRLLLRRLLQRLILRALRLPARRQRGRLFHFPQPRSARSATSSRRAAASSSPRQARSPPPRLRVRLKVRVKLRDNTQRDQRLRRHVGHPELRRRHLQRTAPPWSPRSSTFRAPGPGARGSSS